MTTVAAPAIGIPFRGLSPFGDSDLDALLFFGRERETEIVVANLLAARSTVLYGPSGVGKTSLLRAGVVRRIREVTGRGGITVVFSSWADDPVAGLAGAIAAETRAVTGRDLPAPPAGATLGEVVDHWTTAADADLFLVLDQLEEHFVYHRDERGPGSLVDGVAEVILRPSLRAHVLLSLRDDTLAELDVFTPLVPGLFANVVRLDRLDRAAATAAILGPVQCHNDAASPGDRVHVEPELVDAVLAQAGTADDPGRIEAPYLQLVMERVWTEELERGSRSLRAATLAELGGAEAIVREHLAGALGGLDDRAQEIASRMFEHLVTPSGTKIAHQSVDLAKFAKAPPEQVEPLLATLAGERILRPLDETAAGVVRYEIFHDVLASAILAWGSTRELEQERLSARRHQRRLVAVAAASLIALVVMAGITIFALTQRHTARTQERSAEARALAATALTQLGRDPELSLLLARRAGDLSASPLVEDVLRQALLQSRVRRIVPLDAPGVDAVFRRGTGTAVALTTTGRVVVADPSSGRILHSFSTGTGRAVLAPTGAYVLAFGRGRAVRLYSVATGSAVRLRTRPATTAVFSPGAELVVTMDSGRVVRVWSTATGALVRRFETARPARVAAISAQGTLLAVGGGPEGRTVEAFSIPTGTRVRRLPERSVATHLLFGPTGRFLAVAGKDGAAWLQNPRTGALFSLYEGRHGAITGLAFSPRATLLATSSTDGAARVWVIGGGLSSILLGHGLDVMSVAFSPDGSRVVTASKDGTARVWNVAGNPVAVLAGHGNEVSSAVFDRTGRSVVTAGMDGTMRLWDAVAEPALTVVRRQQSPVPAARFAGRRIVVAPAGSPDVAVSRDGSLYATAAGTAVVVRRASSDAVIGRFSAPARVTGIAVAPDDKTVAVAGTDRSARIYRLDGALLRQLRGAAALTRIEFSPDGTRLAAGSVDHTARIWNVATGRAQVLRGHSDEVLSARFSPDGSRLVTAGRDHYARIWDLATGRVLHVLRGAYGRVADAAFSSDGRWVVTAGPSKAALFDTRSGDRLFYLQGHDGPLTSASFGPDGRTIVTSGADGTVRTYRCDLCAGVPGLKRLADQRLAATGRSLTPGERRDYLP